MFGHKYFWRGCILFPSTVVNSRGSLGRNEQRLEKRATCGVSKVSGLVTTDTSFKGSFYYELHKGFISHLSEDRVLSPKWSVIIFFAWGCLNNLLYTCCNLHSVKFNLETVAYVRTVNQFYLALILRVQELAHCKAKSKSFSNATATALFLKVGYGILIYYL